MKATAKILVSTVVFGLALLIGPDVEVSGSGIEVKTNEAQAHSVYDCRHSTTVHTAAYGRTHRDIYYSQAWTAYGHVHYTRYQERTAYGEVLYQANRSYSCRNHQGSFYGEG